MFTRHVLFPCCTTLFGLLMIGDLAGHPVVAVIGPNPPAAAVVAQPTKSFEPFTGRVTRSRVRIRVGADLNSPIVRELDQNALISVLGEDNNFYAIKPPKDIIGYVYRNYVLDNVVDATNVNVRLEPNLDGTVLVQLNKGDRIEGKISPLHSRWLEISLPASVRFYVAKDFVEKVGAVDLLQRLQARREESSKQINAAFVAGQVELQKPLADVNLEGPISDLEKITVNYSDLSDAVSHAKNVVTTLQEAYRQKKAGVFGPQSPLVVQQAADQPSDGGESVPQPPVAQQQQDVEKAKAAKETMAYWIPKEMDLFEQWHTTHPDQTLEDFYAEQRTEAVQLRGVLQPYMRQVKNKPGNYLLINHMDNQPIAFLYSTEVDLQPKVGQIISVVALPRSNNHFAFPSFFVLSAE